MRERLAELLARRLLEAGRHREFHIELSDLIRRYLELRYRVPALERTTEEIADEMARALIGPPAVAATVAMLERCDRVKFAKHVPPSGETAETVGLAREVIERTAPPPAPLATEPGAAPAGSAA